MGNQALWETTALFITDDEHDGYFDHVLPGSPETTVTNEFIGGLSARRLRRLLRRDHHREHERRLHPPLRRPHRVRKEHGQKQSG